MTQIAEQQHTVNLIADLTHSEVSMSKFLLSTTQLARIGVPENLGTIVFANGNRFVTAIERVADTYVPRVKGNMHFAQNLDEAYDIIGRSSSSDGQD